MRIRFVALVLVLGILLPSAARAQECTVNGRTYKVGEHLVFRGSLQGTLWHRTFHKIVAVEDHGTSCWITYEARSSGSDFIDHSSDRRLVAVSVDSAEEWMMDAAPSGSNISMTTGPMDFTMTFENPDDPSDTFQLSYTSTGGNWIRIGRI